MPRTELFLGNLARDVGRRDIENVFDKYGRLLRCDLKNRGFGANYAFIEFEDERDAEDALRAENGKDMLGSSMVVEWAKSKGDRRDRGGSDRYRGSDYRSGRGGGVRSVECYECGERGHYARDCRNRRGSGRNRMDRDRDSSRDRRRRDSRDRDSRRDRDRRHSRSHSRTRSHSRHRSYSRSPKPRSHSRGRNDSNHSRGSTTKRDSRDRRSSRDHSRGHSNHNSKSRSRSPSFRNNRDAEMNDNSNHE